MARTGERRQLRLYPDDSLLAGAPLRQPLLYGGDHVFGVGPAGAEEASQHVAAARDDGLAVDDHVELPALPDLERGIDVEAFLDDGGETRRPRLVASSTAVKDLDLHVVSMGVAVSAVELLVKRRVFYAHLSLVPLEYSIRPVRYCFQNNQKSLYWSTKT